MVSCLPFQIIFTKIPPDRCPGRHTSGNSHHTPDGSRIPRSRPRRRSPSSSSTTPDIPHHDDQRHQEDKEHTVHIAPGKVGMHHAESFFIEDQEHYCTHKIIQPCKPVISVGLYILKSNTRFRKSTPMGNAIPMIILKGMLLQ